MENVKTINYVWLDRAKWENVAPKDKQALKTLYGEIRAVKDSFSFMFACKTMHFRVVEVSGKPEVVVSISSSFASQGLNRGILLALRKALFSTGAVLRD